VPSRLTRDAAKQRTREELIAAARKTFLERGFHAASLAEIAERAGYTTGAIYSNFGGKDDLYLEMLDVELEARAESQRRRMRDAPSFDAGIRAAARDLHEAGLRDPGMTPLMVEFWIYAARDPALRSRARALHERQVALISELVRELSERHGVRFRLPADEVARGGGALSRGVRLERLLDPAGVGAESFEEMFAAYLTGLVAQAGD
jgi:AcrR family transcriptional regulator